MAQAKRKPLRHRQYAEIHMIRKEIGMDDDSYRMMLQQVAGVTSSKQIRDYASMQAVIDHLRSLRARSKRTRRQASNGKDAMLAKIEVLWKLLADAGVVHNPGPAALQRWAARVTGINKLQWLENGHKAQLIEALKQWCERERVPYRDSKPARASKPGNNQQEGQNHA